MNTQPRSRAFVPAEPFWPAISAGDWTIDWYRGGPIVIRAEDVDHDDEAGCAVDRGGEIVSMIPLRDSETENRANVRMMSASKALYFALRALVPGLMREHAALALDLNREFSHAANARRVQIEACFRAIAKAEGSE